ncbi:signal peptidase I [Isobaculum melis]|uniref:Signal peptidase I n=1 Tax=Isobaculum melis TaxID=142588 RepID=A0A1H9RXB3_9LACT|nr:signal peptidase I [Isobaculum melis]
MKKSWRDHLWDWFKAILIALAFTLVLRNFVFIPVVIDGTSMAPTIEGNDRILMTSFSAIKRFDVIVFQDSKGKTYVKRVIGLPGERISYKDDALYIDDQQIDEKFLSQYQDEKVNKHELWTSDFTLEEITSKKTVPKNQFFVLGDNRRSSKDSRYFGTINENQVIGKVIFIYGPREHIGFIHK